MPLPKVPFSLFDFDFIKKFENESVPASAAAGAAVDKTVYTCPPSRFALLLDIQASTVKTTGTAMQIIIQRARKAQQQALINEQLASETIGTGVLSYPSGKATTAHVSGWTLKFLFPGDVLKVTQALTAGETIVMAICYTLIEYDDPRVVK